MDCGRSSLRVLLLEIVEEVQDLHKLNDHFPSPFVGIGSKRMIRGDRIQISKQDLRRVCRNDWGKQSMLIVRMVNRRQVTMTLLVNVIVQIGSVKQLLKALHNHCSFVVIDRMDLPA